MITELDLADDAVAHAVHTVGIRSYTVEATLIDFDGIPALRESLTEMRARPLRWLGRLHDGLPVAFLAFTRTDDGELDIDRLCVDPDWFRQGIAAALLAHLLDTQPGGDVLVSTGAANTPALTLYQRFRFRVVGTMSPAPGLTTTQLRLDRH